MKSEDCTATLKYSYDSDDELTVPAYCHTEKLDSDSVVRYVVCKTFCNGAMTVYLIAKRPANNAQCIKNFNYQVVQRGKNWLLMRSGACLKNDIQIDVGCLFDYSADKIISLSHMVEEEVRNN